MIETRHISFPHIEQFRNVVKEVKDKTFFAGKDENGNVIYDNSKTLPILTFKGTVKLHGTNHSFVIGRNGEFWTQSRERITTPEKDNNGSSIWTINRKDFFENKAKEIFEKNPNIDGICIFGEFAGKGVQAKVAISEIDKFFCIFGIKAIEGENTFWMEEELFAIFKNEEKRIFNINDFETFSIDIDFSFPEISINKMVEFVEKVENECPVGKAFGVSGIGEGIVWKAIENPAFIFKTKGEKHQNSKVKKIIAVDTEEINNIKEFVENSCSENRLEQGITKLEEKGFEVEMKNIGVFIKWVVGDIMREERDTIENNKLDDKKIPKVITEKAKKWFISKMNSKL